MKVVNFKSIGMKRTFLLFIFIMLGLACYAQTMPIKARNDAGKHHNVNIRTSVPENFNGMQQGPPPPPPGHRNFFRNADTLALGDYMISIQRVNDKLNSVRDSVQLGFEIVRLGDEINNIAREISQIRQNARNRHSAVNVRGLYLYQSFATSLNEENNRISLRINSLYDRTYTARIQLKRALEDSVFRAIYVDKAAMDTLDRKLTRVERKWRRTDSTVKASIDTLNNMKVSLADNSMKLSDMLNIMNKRLNRAKPQIFGPEVSYIWQMQDVRPAGKDSISTLNVLSSENRAIGYYFNKTSGKKGILLFAGILLFVWLFFKRKLLKEIKYGNKACDFMNLHILNNNPVLSILVTILCLLPFFDAYAPVTYVAVEYLILLAAASAIFCRKSGKPFMTYWYAFTGLLIADTLIYLLIEPAFVTRLLMMAVHVAIIATAIGFYKNKKIVLPHARWVRPAVVTGIILTGFAVIANIFGRFSLSGILGLSGIYAITQAMILPIFTETIQEIVLVQLLGSRLKKGIERPFDASVVNNKIRIPLLLVVISLWLVMLTSNLNIYHDLTGSLNDFFTAERSIGSFSFRIASVVFFFLIIWLANVLQKLISFLFGETGDDLEDMTTISKGQHSRLLVIRLILLICGFLLAVVVSGLPLDKITIVLGALGVGIGMGLQNVVNNFVSGIILIFDHSLQIGDEIEIGGQAGKVKEIGLRASTINTADGAEIIIPNGSILSQNIVNWTYSNDQKRVTVSFTLSGKELDANVLNQVINGTIENIPNVIVKRKPAIIFTKVTPESLSLTVHFWSTIGNIDKVRSDAMLKLSAAFEAMKIGFNKPTLNCPLVSKPEN